jgi:hypothetical protein
MHRRTHSSSSVTPSITFPRSSTSCRTSRHAAFPELRKAPEHDDAASIVIRAMRKHVEKKRNASASGDDQSSPMLLTSRSRQASFLSPLWSGGGEPKKGGMQRRSGFRGLGRSKRKEGRSVVLESLNYEVAQDRAWDHERQFGEEKAMQLGGGEFRFLRRGSRSKIREESAIF